MDLPSERELMKLIADLHRRRQLTVVLVSHLLHVVLSHVSRVATIHDGVLRLHAVDELADGAQLAATYDMALTVKTIGRQRIVVVDESPRADEGVS